MEKVEEVKIEKLDHLGNGIGYIDKKVIFVKDTSIGDIVNVRIIEKKKNYLLGEVVDYIKKTSLDTICKYSDICGGCNLLHMSYEDELKYKLNLVKEMFKYHFGSDIIVESINSTKELNYRNKITLHGNGNKIGLYKARSNELVNIDYCYLTDDRINNVIDKLIFDANDDISKVVIRSTSLDDILVSISGKIDDKKFKANNDIPNIVVNGNVVKGSGVIKERINEYIFNINHNSFFQVNLRGLEILYNRIIDFVEFKKYHCVLDLYSGVSTIGILISKYVDKVISVEVVKDAYLMAKENIINNNIKNVELINQKVESVISKFKAIDLVIIDPPRTGLDKKTINHIKRINSKEIIYVSCDLSTLIRDIKILDNYEIKKLEIVDMFPRTYHVECVSILKRKNI